MHAVELVEQLALDPLPAARRVLLLQARLDRLLELVERFEAERLGERVVDGDAGRASIDFAVTSNSASFPASLRRHSWPGNVTFTCRVSPAAMPISWSSKPGMNVPDPT